MKIIWHEPESVFAAEFSQDFTGDLDAVKTAGFRTFGAPGWLWYSPSPGLKALDRLKKNPPKSGLTITEFALEKYKLLSEQAEKKAELKKVFEKEKKVAVSDRVKRPTYEKNGFISFVVEQKDEEFVNKYVKPASPETWCFICGDPVFDYEGTDTCLWCQEKA